MLGALQTRSSVRGLCHCDEGSEIENYGLKLENLEIVSRHCVRAARQYAIVTLRNIARQGLVQRSSSLKIAFAMPFFTSVYWTTAAALCAAV